MPVIQYEETCVAILEGVGPVGGDGHVWKLEKRHIGLKYPTCMWESLERIKRVKEREGANSGMAVAQLTERVVVKVLDIW